MSKYHQLTHEQRYVIYKLKKQGFTQCNIAEIISVSASTICRELKRNIGKKGYRPKQAHKKCIQRRQNARKYIKFTTAIKLYVCQELRQYLSPEQIVGKAKRINREMVSTERIYRFIWSDKEDGGELYKYLRCSNKKKRKRYGGNDRRGQIKNRRFIDERPAIVDRKQRIGDYEIDTMVGKGRNSYLITMVERKSKHTLIGLTRTKRSDHVSKEIIKRMAPIKQKVYTITADNGKEFVCHEDVAKALEAEFYFAHPYSSWERALNENTNGLIRQFFPKGYDFSKITKIELETVMHLLNNRPRKSLDFKTPNEVFWSEVT
jgi:transposase, IS30 family